MNSCEKQITTPDGFDLILFRSGWSVFSNFYRSPFIHEGITYRTAEQFYQARKAQYFKAYGVHKAILTSWSPRMCKKMGRDIKNFNREAWSKVEKEAMHTALYLNFSQNKKLKKQLLATGSAIIAEASAYDSHWGIGLDVHDERALDPLNWVGENLLGQLLMTVAEALKD